jgi:NADH-quinone oxidoreductase subunit J
MQNSILQQLSNTGIPSDSFAQVCFYAIAGMACVFALLTVVSRNVFHSAVFLALTLLSIAGIYLLLDAQFLAVAQVIIYVGAIMILFVFVIMFTSRLSDKAVRQVNRQVLPSVLTAVTFLYILYILIVRSSWLLPPVITQPLPSFTIRQLGNSLLTKYALPFEVISVILLAVLVGSIAIGKADKE